MQTVAEKYRAKKHEAAFWQPEAELIPVSNDIPDIPRAR